MNLTCALLIVFALLIDSTFCCLGRGAGRMFKSMKFNAPKIKPSYPDVIQPIKLNRQLTPDWNSLPKGELSHWGKFKPSLRKFDEGNIKSPIRVNIWSFPRTNIGPKKRVGPKGRVVCYFRDWTISRPGKGRYGIEDVPGDLCTHVVYSFVGLNNDTWELLVLEPQIALVMKGFSNFTTLKTKFPGLKTLLALGGWAEGGLKYSQMVADRAKRQSVINSIKKFMKLYHFDGIDIHWEYPGALDRDGSVADKDNFYFFIEELRRSFDKEKKSWEITMAIPLREEVVRDGYHLPELCQRVDAVHVMTYGTGSSWNRLETNIPLYKRSHNTTPNDKYNVNDGLRALEEMGCPANKIVLGVPLYGRISTFDDNITDYNFWAPSNETILEEALGNFTIESDILEYYEMCQEIQYIKGWTEKWDEEGSVPYAYKTNQWIGYENAKSIQIKMNFIKLKKYAGAMAWALDMDDFRGVCGTKYPLINILHSNMKDYVLPADTRNISIPRHLSEFPPPITEAPWYTQTCYYNTYVRHEKCNKYYECVQERNVERICPENTVFDMERQDCGSPQTSGLPECRQMASNVCGPLPLLKEVVLVLLIVRAAS